MRVLWKGLGAAAIMGGAWLVVHNLLAYFSGKPLGVTNDLWVISVAAFFGRMLGARFWDDKEA